MPPEGTPSDYGELERKLTRIESDQGLDIGRLQRRTSTPKLIAIGTMLASLAGTPMAIEWAKPDPPPPATKQDVEALRREVSELREYLQSKHHADEERWRVTMSAIDRLGFKVRGGGGGSSDVKWQSKSAKALEFQAKDDMGRDVVVEYPLPPQ